MKIGTFSKMDTREIRRNNLRELAEKYGGQKALADAADLAPNQLNHIIGPNPIRNVGEQLARKIELQLGLNKGYLDSIHSKENKASILATTESIYIPHVSIKMVDSELGYILEKEGDGLFKKDWAKDRGVDPTQVFQFKMNYDNMSPTILKDDFLIIDSSRIDTCDSNIYLIILNGIVHVKRVFYLLSNEVRISNDSDNKMLYPDIVTNVSNISQLRIIGQVIAIQRNLPL